MAIIKIGQIRSTLKAAISYIVAPDKTREGIMTSSNCAVPWDADAIATVMEGTAAEAARVKTVGAKGTVLAYHVIQSFKSGEIDANTAHRLGVEFANAVTSGQHEYVIATHTDRDHVHNHIIFNAVNQQTLKKYRCPKSRVYEYRSISDQLCRAYGLSVIENPSPDRRMHIGEVYARADGRSTKAAIAAKIDVAVTGSTTWQEMVDRLAEDGVAVHARGAHVLFRDSSAGHGVRGTTLGMAYTEANLRARLGRSDVCEYVAQRRLITMLDGDRARIRLPGIRDRFIVVSRAHVADHGKTYRVFLPSTATVKLTDAAGRLAGERTADGLYEFFTRPETLRARLAGLAENMARGKTAAQRRYYASVDRQVARLHAEADVVNIRASYAAAADKPGFLAALRASIGQTSREETRLVLARQKVLDAGTDASPVDRDLESTTRRLAALRAAHIQLSRPATHEKEMKL